ncbi:hypothetical protein JCM6882_003086 [Rhodosporidiobolus microsporus]
MTDPPDTPLTSQVCAVCPAPATTRCSGCPAAGVFFCSRECQKLVWSSHSALCGKDPSTFFFPPLIGGELGVLERFKDAEFGYCIMEMQGKTLLAFAKDEGLFDGTWEEFISVVGDPLPSASDARTSILRAFAHVHISTATHPIALQYPSVPLNPWNQLATHFVQAIFTDAHYVVLWPQKDDPAPFQVFNPYLRQVLLHYTLTCAVFSGKQRPSLSRRNVELSLERAQKVIDTLPIPLKYRNNVKIFRSALNDGC